MTSLLKLSQKLSLNILENYIQFCEENNLNYFLIGGSLLGAIRHKGFIPWDDDVDVGMPRKDYNQFLKLGATYFTETRFFLQTPFSDKNYGLSYSKLLDRHTFIEEKNSINNARKGVFIDIFPFDQIPSNPTDQDKQISKFRYYDSLILLRLHYNFFDTPLRKFQTTNNQTFQNVNELKKKRDHIMQMYNSSEEITLVKNLASQYAYNKEILSVAEMTQLTSKPFENVNMAVPQAYDVILTRMYGDYSQLPPKRQQSEKHLRRLIYDNQEYD